MKTDIDSILYTHLPRVACEKEWEIKRDFTLGGSIKFPATHRLSGHTAIIKSMFINTVFGEYFWYRIALYMELPAAPVQFITMPEELIITNGHRSTEDDLPLGEPVGALIYWIKPIFSGTWLWQSTSEYMRRRNIDVRLTSRLKALCLWMNPPELGEFFLTRNNTPLLLDLEEGGAFGRDGDSLFYDSHSPFPHFSLKKYLPDFEQHDYALSLWKELGEISTKDIAAISYLPDLVAQRFFDHLTVEDYIKFSKLWRRELFEHFRYMFRKWSKTLSVELMRELRN